MKDDRLKRKPDIVAREVDDSVFLVGPDDDALFHLNTTGAAIWRLLAEPVGMDEVIRTLAAAFPDLPPEDLRKDVEALVADLEAQGFLVRVD